MHIFISNLFRVIRELFSAKTAKSELVDPHLQWTVGSDQNVHPQIKFLATDEVGVVNVARDHITFFNGSILEREFGLSGPAFDLIHLIN